MKMMRLSMAPSLFALLMFSVARSTASFNAEVKSLARPWAFLSRDGVAFQTTVRSEVSMIIKY